MLKRVALSVVVFLAGFSLLSTLSASGARAAEEMTVYSSNMQPLNDLAATEFQKATGIKANMVRVPSGVSLKRIRAEKDNPHGDVSWGIGKVAIMSNLDLFEPYKSRYFDLVAPESRDPEYRWIGTNLQLLVFMYDKELLKDGESPRKWSDLIDPKWKNKIAYPNPANSVFAFTSFTMMLHEFGNNEAAWKKMEAFLENVQVLEQSPMVPISVEKGEFPLGISQEYVVTRYLVSGAKIGMIYPEDGNAIQTETAAIIKGTKNRKAAEKFVDFCNDRNFRELVVKDQFRRPARKDLDFSKLVPIPPLSQIKMMPGYSEIAFLNERDKILARVKDILLKIK